MRGRRHGSYARAALLILSAILAISLVIVANSATVEAERYSAYEDPEKPVISYLLSDAESADRFQTEFGLTDQEMKGVLAAIREENETLAREYAGSERKVAASGGLPKERAREKIAASDYDERVRETIARTKSGLEELLPSDRRHMLETWGTPNGGKKCERTTRSPPTSTGCSPRPGERYARCMPPST